MLARAPLTLFYSYSHKDESLREQLETHLSILRRQGSISEWYDRKIVAGTERAQQIDEHLESASLILLLISPDFLASDYCYDIEMQRALKRHDQKDACVIPIILRPCDWRNAPFAGLQSLPRNGIPIAKWDDPDEAFLDITQELRHVIEAYPAVPALTAHAPSPSERTSLHTHIPRSRVASKNRERLIRRVRNDWIKGVFEKSLHNDALITLGLQELPKAVENPWRLVIQESSHTSTPLPAGTSITEVYDDADGELLILGEPGAGKTTLLLELARDLLNRAEQELDSPMPVVFSLSSWKCKRQPLADWLIEEMETRYKVPRMVGSDWVNANQILPLLDGLDEVDAPHRSSCIQAINEYHKAHNLVPLVVCCRVNECLSQTNRLALSRAVTIQPLTSEQINEYFARIGEQITSLRIAFQNDPVLQELAKTPLRLTVLIMAYQGSSLEDIKGGVSAEIRQKQIFTMYTQRMLQHQKLRSRYSPQQTIRWLSYLARQMKQQSQTVFYIERMQPGWLTKKWQRRLYYSLTTGPICGLLIGLNTLDTVVPFPLAVLMTTLIVGLLFGWLSEQEAEKKGTETTTYTWMRIRQKLATALENRVAIGIIASLATGIGSVLYFYVVDYDHLSFKIRIAFALSNGLLSGMGVGLSLGLAIKLDKRIEPMEVLSWSWTAIRRNIFRWLLIGIGIGLILGLIFVLTFMMSRPSLWLATFPRDGLPGALHLVLILMLVNGVRRGLSKRVLGTQPIIAPNQGTWRSARYGGGIAIISGVIIGVLNGATTFMGAFWLPSHMGIHMDRGRSFSVDIMSHVLGFYPTTGHEFWTLYALFSGLENGTIVGLAAGLYCGWAAFIQHFVLRFLLWCARCVPFNYSRFLDYAAERILLRKVGGGYIFIHRLLLDYFASLEEEQTPRKVDATEHKQDALV